jgi:hypothetical protein
LLPVGTGLEPFEIDGARGDVAVESGVIRVHFTLPPLPTTVTPRSFEVRRWNGQLESIPIGQVRVVSDPRDEYPGSTVEIVLAPQRPLEAADSLYLFVADDVDAVRDYRGRAPTLPSRISPALPLTVHRGAALYLVEEAFDGPTPPPLIAAGVDTLGFEVRDRRAVPRVRLEAGDGGLGFLSPAESTTLDTARRTGAAGPEDGGSLSFTGVYVPAGVRVRIAPSSRPLAILATGNIVIDGELLLETAVVEPQNPWPRFVSAADIIEQSGCTLLAGGDIIVRGRIVHAAGSATSSQSPLSLVAGGELVLTGRIPPRTVIGGKVVGQVQAPEPVTVRLHPSLPPTAGPLRAAAWTAWRKLPAYHRGMVAGRAIGVAGGLRVHVQTAPADPLDPTRPDERPEVLRRSTPLNEGFEPPPGSFVRFRLEADLDGGGSEVPSVQSLVLAPL